MGAMADRLPWQRTDQPKRFAAVMPEGRAEVWWKDRDVTPPSWCYRIQVGKTIGHGTTETNQAAADRATALWPDLVRQEQARVSKIEAQRHLEHAIEEAHHAGRVDVMAFGLGSSDYARLIAINEILRTKGWLSGAVKPLAEAVSAELFRRRSGGKAW